MVKTGDREYKSDFARGYFREGAARGEARGEAKMILTVLAARGIPVSEQVRERVGECDDLQQLEDWGRRAATADSIEDVFATGGLSHAGPSDLASRQPAGRSPGPG